MPAWSRGHLGNDPAAAPQPKHPRIPHRQVGLLARAHANRGTGCVPCPAGCALASDELTAKVADASQTNAVSGADAATHVHTWHQMSKAQKHHKRAVSRVSSCLLSPGRSPSIRRSDGRTSGHWNIWVASVLSGRATCARPFWASAPYRAIAWGPTAALTALDLQRQRDSPPRQLGRLGGWQGQQTPRPILSQQLQPHFLASQLLAVLASPASGWRSSG